MKSRSVDTVASNEEFVRLRIFDGDLQIGEAAAELLRIEREQHAATRRLLDGALLTNPAPPTFPASVTSC